MSRFLAAVIAAWFSMSLLNAADGNRQRHLKGGANRPNEDSTRTMEIEDHLSNEQVSPDFHEFPVSVAGKTIDFTALAVTRAIDTVIVSNCCPPKPISTFTKIGASTFRTSTSPMDSLIFAFSSGLIMWAWFYLPNRLPQAYNQWIGEAAQVDERLIHLLREARKGNFIYGKDTGQASVLLDMCKDYGWPLSWANPEKTVPIPCEIVHMGTGPSCHFHALVRFSRAFKFALATNLPLQVLAKSRRPSTKAFQRACEEALQSSAFLGAFVGAFYYGVCLSRSVLGPRVFDRTTVSPMMWDSGLCIGAGCMLCGWSILIEASGRRPELALFVAPRALATFLPRQYEMKVCCPIDAIRCSNG